MSDDESGAFDPDDVQPVFVVGIKLPLSHIFEIALAVIALQVLLGGAIFLAWWLYFD